MTIEKGVSMVHGRDAGAGVDNEDGWRGWMRRVSSLSNCLMVKQGEGNIYLLSELVQGKAYPDVSKSCEHLTAG